MTYSSATGYRLNHSFTVVRNEHRIPFPSSRITQDYSSWNSYRLAAQAQAGRYNWTNYVYWAANCARIQ
ncbi:MAG: hypothetical protein HYY76_14610 [Acidobacteria bacterium]|nr:hypothetical protein [Acidobacteriota bacterium]